MINEIVYPATEEEYYAIGYFTIGERETYFEIPAVFVEGIVDQTATEAKVLSHIEHMTIVYAKIFNTM